MLRTLAACALALAIALPLHAGTPVNVNTADAATLAESLDGIGPAKASAIVAWREAHGPFKNVDELAQIKGIGDETLARIRPHVLLSEGKAAPAPASAPAPATKSALPAAATVKR